MVLRVEGADFQPDSLVRFDTIDLETEFVSVSELRAFVRPASLRLAGSYAVTVVNPGSGGGVSDVIYFIVGIR